MKYDLSINNKNDRRRFTRYANQLLKKQRSCVSLTDESGRTTSQNKYLHVLCRILATDIGVTEAYAKQVYLKTLACPDIFVTMTKDPIAKEMVKVVRSTKDLTIPEMRKVIISFRDWAAYNGYYLPNASVNDDGTVTFASEEDKKAFVQADIMTSGYE